MKLSVNIGPLKLKNPVMTASGTFGYGREYAEFVDPGTLGAVVTKGISLKPRQGNPMPRITETACGMINAIGLQNVGLRVFLKEKLPYLRQFDTKVIVNILGETPEEYVRLAQRLAGAGVDAIEMNVSCPNVKRGGIEFASDQSALGRLIKRVRAVTAGVCLIVKLSPNTSDIREPARRAEDAGADAISLINTIPAMAVDVRTRRPVLANTIGGLSGPAIKPVALRMVWQAASAVSIPVIGIGGIGSGTDAVEFMLAGASAVQVGTANFINPSATTEVLGGIISYLQDNGLDDVNAIIGGLLSNDNPDD